MSPDEAAALVAKAQQDPGWWLDTALGAAPWAKQLDILNALKTQREVAVKSCHSAGKSWTAARCVLWYLFTHPQSIVITTAPTDRQVRGILWREIRTAHKRAVMPLGGKTLTQHLELDDDWWATGFTAPDYDPNRFQGFHAKYVLVVVDEASGVSNDIYEAIQSILSGEHGCLLSIGNPTEEQSYFGQSFKTPGVHKISISAFDTPNFTTYGITLDDIRNDTWADKITGPLPAPTLITPEWVRGRLERWGEMSPMFQSRVLANFPPQGTDTLIPLAWIEAAQNRNLEPDVNAEWEIGVDVARFGADDTEIYARRGPVLRHDTTLNGADLMAVTGHALNAMRRWHAARIKVDVIGVGSGVVDRLVEQDVETVGVNFGAGPRDKEKFRHVRDEAFWCLRERFQDGDIDIDPDDEELAEQLASIKYKYNSRGQIEIEPKDKMKERISRSPDRADAAAIAFYEAAENFAKRDLFVAPPLASASVDW